MSIAIATLGMFAPAKGTGVAGGGSTLVREEETVRPLVLVKNVEYEKNGVVKEDLVIVKSVKSNGNGN